MTRSAISLLTACCLSLAISACRPAAPPVSISNQPLSVNNVRQPGVPSKPIEQMSWVAMDGTDRRMSDYSGKVVILDFWATYCEPCRREIPHLNSLLAEYGQDQLEIVGLHAGGDEDRPKIPSFASEMKMAYQVGFPEDALVSYIFGGETAIPQTAVFDRKGRLVIKIIGFDERIGRELDSAVAQAARN